MERVAQGTCRPSARDPGRLCGCHRVASTFGCITVVLNISHCTGPTAEALFNREHQRLPARVRMDELAEGPFRDENSGVAIRITWRAAMRGWVVISLLLPTNYY